MHFPTQALALLAAVFITGTTAAATCKVGAAWPDSHDCHSFWECGAGGIPVRKTCGPGTAYSPSIGVCDYEYKVPSCHHWGHGKEHGNWGHGKGHGNWGHGKQPGHEGSWKGHGEGHGAEGGHKPSGEWHKE
ncbi:hypothetical protein BJY04DRAFT_214123 [Aspergillus karnatakaensis]|uniref:carbohydrate-binding module family 14 protein n=1 Tax=Aspergillus karnatakaensis TaxID=1810916 RepID=UPI003CCDA58D